MNKIKYSIIIPVYNDSTELSLLLPKLFQQQFDTDLYEVIVVENGNSKEIEEVCKLYNVIFIREVNHLNSPYSCRNRGIEIANGKILIFIDATCHPINTWLYAIDNCFSDDKIDLLAGKVSFRFHGEYPTAAEYYDSITNIKMKEAVLERNVAKTANLSVRRKVVDKVGMFEEGLRSGGDVAWSGMATKVGFKIKFSEEAEVKKIARMFKDLAKKQYRVGLGQPAIWVKQGQQLSKLKIFLKIFKIMPRSKIYKESKAIRKFRLSPFRVYLVGSSLRILQRTGNFISSFKA